MKIINAIHKYKQSGRNWFQRSVKNITRITVHHDAVPNNGKLSEEQCLDILYRTHTSRNWPGAAYHFWISKKGSVYQLNNYSDITWHDGINSDSIAVCLNGYFHHPYNEAPTKEQLASLKWLLDELCTKHPEFPADHDDVKGHRERKPTACPGDKLQPFVKEYRDKKGNVSWGTVKPVQGFDPFSDMGSDLEEALNLKSYGWYNKHWSLADLVKYTDELYKKQR